VYTSLLQMLQPAAQTTPKSSASSSSSPASSSSNQAQDMTTMFLQLLTAQLKAQSPINPLDPNAFVAQLAQFDSLGALIQIQTLMQTLVNDVKAAPIPH
jgi:flagellar basal-body rod modification protein FlgD